MEVKTNYEPTTTTHSSLISPGEDHVSGNDFNSGTNLCQDEDETRSNYSNLKEERERERIFRAEIVYPKKIY